MTCVLAAFLFALRRDGRFIRVCVWELGSRIFRSCAAELGALQTLRVHVTQPGIIHRAVPVWATGSASATPLGHGSDCQCDEACRYGDSHFRFDR